MNIEVKDNKYIVSFKKEEIINILTIVQLSGQGAIELSKMNKEDGIAFIQATYERLGIFFSKEDLASRYDNEMIMSISLLEFEEKCKSVGLQSLNQF